MLRRTKPRLRLDWADRQLLLAVPDQQVRVVLLPQHGDLAAQPRCLRYWLVMPDKPGQQIGTEQILAGQLHGKHRISIHAADNRRERAGLRTSARNCNLPPASKLRHLIAKPVIRGIGPPGPNDTWLLPVIVLISESLATAADLIGLRGQDRRARRPRRLG